jgi:hypothetical protein
MRAPGIEKGKMGDVVDLYKINAELDFKNVEVGGGEWYEKFKENQSSKKLLHKQQIHIPAKNCDLEMEILEL